MQGFVNAKVKKSHAGVVRKFMLAAAGVLLIGYLATNASKIYQNAGKTIQSLTQSTVSNTNWVKVPYTQPEKGFYRFYAAEDVEHTTDLWHDYQFEVKKMNKFDNLGFTSDKNIWLPDLDGDGRVGQAEIDENKKN